MEAKVLKKLQDLLRAGRLEELDLALKKHLIDGDLDARYLNVHYSSKPLGGDEFDKRLLSEIQNLAKELHPESLQELAWKYRHGDGVEKDSSRYQLLLALASILGNKDAIAQFTSYCESELDYGGLAVTVRQRLKSNPKRDV